MGTNYYARFNACSHCGHSEDVKHIGKSSGGWNFSLHVYPEEGINTLTDWVSVLSKENVDIFDEYDEPMTMTALLERITERVKSCQQHPIDERCIGHGEGTWDYFIGEFS